MAISKMELRATLQELGIPILNGRVRQQDLLRALGAGTDNTYDLYPKTQVKPSRDRYEHKDPSQYDEGQLLKRAKTLFNVLVTKLGVGKPFGRGFEPLELKEKAPSDIAKDLADNIQELEKRDLNPGLQNIVKDMKRRAQNLKFLNPNLEPGEATKAA